MKNPRPFRRVRLSPLDSNRSSLAVRMRRDNQHPGRIFVEFPKCALMTEQQAINLANAIADTVEDK
ncbi:hypothetical protein QP986_10630 [Corynebacterium striatum]|uniref:hypothetical protein n=1 Tax=Corynebacterium striatum TaxID=43770 RepID=UPI00254F9A3F|nr:hypothetical protein [Corynebacterium striatum]MDK8844520.1 hypothetical protein [Corynebacterium striatum]